jgi:hypothetical protein
MAGVEEQHGCLDSTGSISIITWTGEVFIVVEMVGVCQAYIHVSPRP